MVVFSLSFSMIRSADLILSTLYVVDIFIIASDVRWCGSGLSEPLFLLEPVESLFENRSIFESILGYVIGSEARAVFL